jgi:serine phosphatase RsbU (regulator of sigma subunit)
MMSLSNLFRTNWYNKSLFILIIICLSSIFHVKSQSPNKKLDSLLTLSNTLKNEELIEIYLQLSRAFEDSSFQLTEEYFFKALNLSKDIKSLKMTAKCYFEGFKIYDENDKTSKALLFLDSALLTYKNINDNEEFFNCLMSKAKFFRFIQKFDSSNIYYVKAQQLANQKKWIAKEADAINGQGVVEYFRGNYIPALAYYQQASLLYESINDTSQLAKSYNNMAIIFKYMNDYESALKYYQLSIKMALLVDGEKGITNKLLNIGQLYVRLNKCDSAIYVATKAKNIYEKSNNIKGVLESIFHLQDIYISDKQYKKADSLSNLMIEMANKYKKPFYNFSGHLGFAISYKKQNLYDKSDFHFNEALKIHKNEKLDDDQWLVDFYYHITELYLLTKEYDKALYYGNLGIENALKSGYKDKVDMIAELIYKVYKSKKDYAKALEIHELWFLYKDSLRNEENNLTLGRMQVKMESDKKEKILLEAQLKQEITIGEQKMMKNLLGVGLVGMMLIAFLTYRNYKRKEKSNKILAEKNEEIQQQSEEISSQRDKLLISEKQLMHKNEELMSGIRYASVIQTAMLPFDNKFQENFGIGNYFILYKPQNLVSGDFYWLESIGNEVIVVVGDCTGHGVPGAFMSVLGCAFMEEIVIAKNITEPHLILTELQKGINHALKQNVTENKDGMDVSIVNIQKSKKELKFAGAMNPIYFIKDEEFAEIKGTKTSIGGGLLSQKNQNFENHNITWNESILVYLFSDGFQDQFGGAKNKKFMTSNFKKLLQNSVSQPFSNQRLALEQALDEWQKPTQEPQTDDITVVGILIQN